MKLWLAILAYEFFLLHPSGIKHLLGAKALGNLQNTEVRKMIIFTMKTEGKLHHLMTLEILTAKTVAGQNIFCMCCILGYHV